MSYSQNGWKALDSTQSGPLPRLRKWVIPGTGRHLVLRDGSAGFVLIHFALWWHEKVEPLDGGVWDEWGWAARPIRGGTTTSNHASGTAMDLNATQHPLGVPVHRTFTVDRATRVRRWLATKKYGGALRWGGDYTTRPDGMHVELVKNLPEVERIARRLMKTPRGRRILAANPGVRQVIES